MNNFDDAFVALIGSEGGYSDVKGDSGGETMYGITKRVALANGYVGGMHDLPLVTAKQIAKKQYWDAHHCDQFDIRISFQLFDAAYNGGHPAQWLQQAAMVKSDGIIGVSTIAAVRRLDVLKIVMRFDAYRIKYLAGLPVWPEFGRGWMNRIAHNLLLAAT